jgi:hypothetical protein
MFVGGHSLVAWCTGAENRESAQLELKATPPRHNGRGNRHFWSFLFFAQADKLKLVISSSNYGVPFWISVGPFNVHRQILTMHGSEYLGEKLGA